jgi:hypothetical protein
VVDLGELTVQGLGDRAPDLLAIGGGKLPHSRSHFNSDGLY